MGGKSENRVNGLCAGIIYKRLQRDVSILPMNPTLSLPSTFPSISRLAGALRDHRCIAQNRAKSRLPRLPRLFGAVFPALCALPALAQIAVVNTASLNATTSQPIL